MTQQSYAYPFDPTGAAPSNLISHERHTITPPDYSDYYFVVPVAGPFFANGFTVIHEGSGRELVEGVDFAFSYQFIEASRALARPVYGAISIYQRDLTGVLDLTYQTIGGEWTINEQKALELLGNALTNPRITTWEQVVDTPYKFPVIDHEWDLDDLVGASELVDAIDRVTQALYDGPDGGTGSPSHVLDFDNPHQVTKDQVGLGNVPNWTMAISVDAQDAIATNKFMSPAMVKIAIDYLIRPDLNAHTNNEDNPHNVDKAQVGLGSVQNYPVADLSTAQEGTSNTHYLTVAMGRALIESLFGDDVISHGSQTDNPHQVTKAQVGLGNVQNYPMATRADIDEGISISTYVSPADLQYALETKSVTITELSNYTTTTDFDQVLADITSTFNDIAAELDAISSGS